MDEIKDYLETMAVTSESIKTLIEMTADIIEHEEKYLDTMIDWLQDQKLFMGAVSEKLDILKANLAIHLENVKEFIEDEEEPETLQ